MIGTFSEQGVFKQRLAPRYSFVTIKKVVVDKPLNLLVEKIESLFIMIQQWSDFTPIDMQKKIKKNIYVKVSAIKYRRYHSDTLPISLLLHSNRIFFWCVLQLGNVMETSIKFQRNSINSSWMRALWNFCYRRVPISVCKKCRRNPMEISHTEIIT